ncbi:cobalamin-dependent protein [Pelotomaculum propionicicum]|uniref:cobalamin-dependent protein n=1 Tax=Pelotomaculum propionicicum TaxID=258475 RepID=UPI003B7B6C24
MQYDEAIIQSILKGKLDDVQSSILKALGDGHSPEDLLNNVLLPAMETVSKNFSGHSFFVADVLISARAIQWGIDILKPMFRQPLEEEQEVIVLGTVEGDIHDIGKNLLALMLRGSGFRVIDLGVDVSHERFVEAIQQYKPRVVGISALLTVTMVRMAETVNVIKEAGLRDKVLIAVGGSPVTEDFAKEIGADYYFSDASTAARVLSKDIKELSVRQSLNPTTFTLGAWLDSEELQQVSRNFTEATGLRVVFLDEKNQHIGPPELMDEFLEHCTGCIRPNKENILNQLKKTPLLNRTSPSDEPFAYFCPAGLVEITTSLFHENQRVGSILCGHFYLAKDPDEQPWHLHHYGIKVFDKEQVESTRGLLKLLADYVIKMAYSNQKEIKVREQQLFLAHALKAKVELEKALRKAELLALQSQVNPHFLFNTLNTIARLAFLEGAEMTEKTVHSLARVLRYNLRRIKEALTIEEEMKTIKDYLFIQQTRFAGRLEVNIDVQDGILGARVPCLALQPIVENAIVHGIEPSTVKGQISVRGYDKDGGIVFEVEDNGIGMSQDEIDRIFNLENLPSGKGHTTGIGLNNIQKRMQAFFRVNCALEIKSTVGKGCKVQLYFPKIH